MKNFFLIFVVNLLLLSCARVGSPVGGPKDSIPPKFLGSNLDTSRVNVKRDIRELRLYFDEYVTLKNISKNLITSPPIKKIKKILPAQLASKYVLIQWEDTLKANTTYNFNFGNAIADNNEGNVLPYFNYAFSTGDKIDNLYISGEVKDALSSKTKNSEGKERNIVVGLYKNSDSINYRDKPYYITNADEDGYFELNYLSPGTYKLVTFEDSNQNSTYDPGKENIGFLKEPINLDKSISGLNLKIYPTVKPAKYKENQIIAGGILFLYEGKPEKADVKSVNEVLKDFKVTHQPKSDSINIWFDAKKENIGIDKNETLKFAINTGKKTDSVSVTYRYNPKSDFALNSLSGNSIAPKKQYTIFGNMPIEKITPEKWTFESDSIKQNFTAKISETNPMEIKVSGDFKEGKKYKLTIPKETVSSYYYTNAKSYRFDFEIDLSTNYGTFVLNLVNASTNKKWIQLLDEKESVVYSKFTKDNNVTFTELKPASYTLRILEDNNGNGFWDEADFSKNIFAEDVYIFPKKVEIKPMWEMHEGWDLKTNTAVATTPKQ